MKNLFKAGWIVLLIGAVMTAIGVAKDGAKSIEFKGIKPQKKFHATRSIMDYADEKIVSFEELEPEERTYCSMLSNLVLGVPLVVVALCISFL